MNDDLRGSFIELIHRLHERDSQLNASGGVVRHAVLLYVLLVVNRASAVYGYFPLVSGRGTVWADLRLYGAPERKPVLPRYECLKVLEQGERIVADDSSIGSGSDCPRPGAAREEEAVAA
jgi:hypothetical protein